jgi:hypothetical protein
VTYKGSEPVYHDLVVIATDPRTDFWLVDEHWHPVQKATGVLDTSVLAGRYFIEFGQATPAGIAYPVKLTRNLQLTQGDLERGPSCPRQAPQFLDDE